MVANCAKTWIGYLEHQSHDLLGVYRANVGKGGFTIFSEIISTHYRWRNFQAIPWCATFVHAVFLTALGKTGAAKVLGKPHPGTKVLMRRMRRKGRLRGVGYTPKANDIIFLHNGDGIVGHVGIVVGVVGDEVISVEGNTVDPTGHFPADAGGAVAMRTRQLTNPAIIGYADL